MAGDLTLAPALQSWGRYPRHVHHVHGLWDRHQVLPVYRVPLLPYGNGRSYGDVCLNDRGVALHTRGLGRFIALDHAKGLLTCESGGTLKEILDLIVPRGWFLPVSPGTKFVTIGGAIANDVHGKNHHRIGSFGSCVEQFELLRSDGTRLTCSRSSHPELFAATLGGLGLTGLITWAQIRLREIHNPWLLGESLRFSNLTDFFALSAESERDYEYTVAWIDCADPKAQGRGLFMRANHAPFRERLPDTPRRSGFRVPFTPPIAPMNRVTLQVFNRLYYWGSRTDRMPRLVHYDPFFYPLDAVLDWNRLYGPRGFLQYQCVVPRSGADAAVKDLLVRIGRRGAGSFLATLKTFGDMPSEGLLSFPRGGVTLALDFPIRGQETFALLAELDTVVKSAGGAVYPAKDARMSPEMFQSGFPRLEEFRRFIDPGFSSSFWRRVCR